MRIFLVFRLMVKTHLLLLLQYIMSCRSERRGCADTTAECPWVLKVLGAQQSFVWQHAGGRQWSGAAVETKSCTHPGSAVETV